MKYSKERREAVLKKMKIYAISTLFNGNEMIRQLLDRGVKLNGVIGLREGVAGTDISGYESPLALCRRYKIEFVPLNSYSMRDIADRQRIEALNIDVALILGWQRLVPDWFLELCKIGAIGVHGSADGITGGRGRSPQNWALILGKKEFHLSIFFADPGVDSGPIIDSQAVSLSEFDDIQASHFKVCRAAVDLLCRNIANGKIASRSCLPQEGDVRYLPQRKPEDGEMDWSRSSVDLYNFVRALTMPYPGAFSRVRGSIIRIWKARPFTEAVSVSSMTRPGMIVDRFGAGELLVATGDGFLFVYDYELDNLEITIMRGNILESCSYEDQMVQIVNRHASRFPTMPLINDLRGYLREGEASGMDHEDKQS